jgi:hypothetical protein
MTVKVRAYRIVPNVLRRVHLTVMSKAGRTIRGLQSQRSSVFMV